MADTSDGKDKSEECASAVVSTLVHLDHPDPLVYPASMARLATVALPVHLVCPALYPRVLIWLHRPAVANVPMDHLDHPAHRVPQEDPEEEETMAILDQMEILGDPEAVDHPDQLVDPALLETLEELDNLDSLVLLEAKERLDQMDHEDPQDPKDLLDQPVTKPVQDDLEMLDHQDHLDKMAILDNPADRVPLDHPDNLEPTPSTVLVHEELLRENKNERIIVLFCSILSASFIVMQQRT